MWTADDLLNLADMRKGFIELDLDDLNEEQQGTALCLARKMNGLNSGQLEKINFILNGKGN